MTLIVRTNCTLILLTRLMYSILVFKYSGVTNLGVNITCIIRSVATCNGRTLYLGNNHLYIFKHFESYEIKNNVKRDFEQAE